MNEKYLNIENMTAAELAAYWRNSEDAAIVIASTIGNLNQQIAELYDENRKLIKKAQHKPLSSGIGEFIRNSWGWIFAILFFYGTPIFGTLQNITAPKCPPPAQIQTAPTTEAPSVPNPAPPLP